MRPLLLVLLIAAMLPTYGSAAQRPNVLLLCIDDLKPLLGCYGDTTVKSPHIDSLAARGTWFDRAYCNQAICGPSRNALLTGLRPQTVGIYDLSTNFRAASPDAVTLPQYFKQHGYHASGLGKIYHTGHGNRDDKRSWSVPSWSTKPVVYLLPENGPKRIKNPGKGRKFTKKGTAFESADAPDSAYAEGKLADKTIRRLKNAAKSPEQPFFMAVGFWRPHLPFNCPKKYWDLYDRSAFTAEESPSAPQGAPPFARTRWGELRQYLGIPKKGPMTVEMQRDLIHGYHAAVSYTDAQVGRVLECLEETGLAKNTIIVLWGDHGWHLGDHGMWCKHTNYEQAARIPLIIATPDGAKQSVSSPSFVESVDIYPTLCDLAGLPVPKHLDGISFRATVDAPSTPARKAAIHVYPRGKRIGQAIRTQRYRLVEWKVPGAADDTAIFELYDYQEDPRETKNLASQRPEVVSQLRRMLAEEPAPKAQR